MDIQRLEQKVAIVTGASSGIGRATALADAGATVVVNHLPSTASRSQADAAVQDITDAGGHAIALAADIAREDQVDAMVTETLDRFGRLDILINNAGIERPSAIRDMTLADWQAVIDVNLTGQFLCSRAAVRAAIAIVGHHDQLVIDCLLDQGDLHLCAEHAQRCGIENHSARRRSPLRLGHVAIPPIVRGRCALPRCRGVFPC